MKALFWAGLIVLVLGIASFFVAVPSREKHGVSVGGASVEIQTDSSQKLPPYVGVILIAGGIVMAVAGARKC